MLHVTSELFEAGRRDSEVRGGGISKSWKSFTGNCESEPTVSRGKQIDTKKSCHILVVPAAELILRLIREKLS
jgi:hypothetical protein